MPINPKRYTETHRYRYVPVLKEKQYVLRYDTDNLATNANLAPSLLNPNPTRTKYKVKFNEEVSAIYLCKLQQTISMQKLNQHEQEVRDHATQKQH